MPRSTSLFARRRKFLVGLPLMLMLGGFASRAEADYLVSNLTSTQGFNKYSGFNVIGPKAVTGMGYAIGVRFTMSGTQSMAFDSAQLALAYRGGTNALDISLRTDQNGIPGGSALETIQITNIDAYPGIVNVNSATHPILSAGVSYWLVATYGAANTNFAWLFNSLGGVGSSAYRPDSLITQGAWIASPTLTDAAYSISGSAAPVAVAAALGAVDSPSSGVLTAIAGLGLLSGHRFQRRRAIHRAVTA